MVSAVAGFVKIRYLADKALIDNAVFRLHYKFTSAILFACCIIVNANNLIGDPINCINDRSVAEHVLNTYCWIRSTFTIPEQLHKPPTHAAHPGLGNPTADDNTTIYHSYYQWVPFMLFFQVIEKLNKMNFKLTFHYFRESCSTFPTGCGKIGKKEKFEWFRTVCAGRRFARKNIARAVKCAWSSILLTRFICIMCMLLGISSVRS